MNNKTLSIFITIFLLIISCTSITVKDKDISGKVLYKNLIKKSEKLKNCQISGLIKISGIKEIPKIFLKFESTCNFPDKKVFFKISTFKTPIISIFLNKDETIFLNHLDKKYIRFPIEKIDFSKLIGMNFNPYDVNYFFLGRIPFSETMELVDFKLYKNDYLLNISDNISNYSILLNKNEEILEVKIINQYFDDIILDNIKYKKNSSGIKSPNLIRLKSGNNQVEMSFVINKAMIDLNKKNIIEFPILDDYKEVKNIDELKIDTNKLIN